MPVSTDDNKIIYAGNGSTDTYSFPYKVFATTDLVVQETNASGTTTTLVKDTNYTATLSNGGDDGAVLVRSAGVLASNYTWTITRVMPLTQTTDYEEGSDAFLLDNLNDNLDKLTMIAQQLDEVQDRTIKIAANNEGVTVELPTPSAGKALLWDSTGKKIENSTDDFNDIVTDAEAAQAAAELAETNAETAKSLAETAQSAAETAQTNAETAETNAETAETNAEEWATKTDGLVGATDNSSKAYAIGGTGVTDTAGKGAAKEWATKTSGTVDGSEYSAKYYAQQSANNNDKVKVSSNDTTTGYLADKLVAGSNITITSNNDGGNETISIASSAVSSDGVLQNILKNGSFEILKADYTEESYDPPSIDGVYSIVGGTASEAKAAQSFKIDNPIACEKIAVQIRKYSSPTDNLGIRIETDDGSGKPSGTLVDANAISSMAAASVSSSATYYDFTLAGVIYLDADTTYHIVMTRSGAEDGTNFIGYECQSGNLYADGAVITYNGTTTNWTATSYDGGFIVYANSVFQDWSALGSATVAQEASQEPDNYGGDNACKVTSAASGDAVTQTLSNLKPSTTYNISCRVKVTAGDTAKIYTTGADTELSETSTSTSWETVTGTFITDATPTDVILKLGSDTNGDIVWFDQVCVYELSAFVPMLIPERFLNATDDGIINTPSQSAVKVGLSSNQSIAASTETKVALADEDEDIQSEFDSTTNYRFTAKVAGNYSIKASAYINAIVDQLRMDIRIKKNGTLVLENWIYSSKSDANVVTLNGDIRLSATDYLELYVYHSDTLTRTLLDDIKTFLHITKLG